MNSSSFQDTFFRIFLVKLTFAEVKCVDDIIYNIIIYIIPYLQIGALMSIVNPVMYDLNVMDGNGFITVLQKLGRMCENILLGFVDHKVITYESLRIPPPPDPRSASRSPSPLPSIARQARAQKGKSDIFSKNPSAELISSERSVSRGIGPDNPLQLPSDVVLLPSPVRMNNQTSLASVSASASGEPDPYQRYMRPLSPMRSITPTDHRDLRSADISEPRLKPNIADRSFSADSQVRPNKLISSGESVVSDITWNSPSALVTPFSPVMQPLGSSGGESSSSMVVSLLGGNPWKNTGELDNGQHRGRRRKK
jgi:hypothetical protein